MQYRNFGTTGILVSVLGFGCMRLPMEGGHVKEEYSIKMLRRAYELGVNYFDTAENYCNTESQIILGKAIKRWIEKKFMCPPRTVTKAIPGQNGVSGWKHL